MERDLLVTVRLHYCSVILSVHLKDTPVGIQLPFHGIRYRRIEIHRSALFNRGLKRLAERYYILILWILLEHQITKLISQGDLSLIGKHRYLIEDAIQCSSLEDGRSSRHFFLVVRNDIQYSLPIYSALIRLLLELGVHQRHFHQSIQYLRILIICDKAFPVKVLRHFAIPFDHHMDLLFLYGRETGITVDCFGQKFRGYTHNLSVSLLYLYTLVIRLKNGPLNGVTIIMTYDHKSIWFE